MAEVSAEQQLIREPEDGHQTHSNATSGRTSGSTCPDTHLFITLQCLTPLTLSEKW